MKGLGSLEPDGIRCRHGDGFAALGRKMLVPDPINFPYQMAAFGTSQLAGCKA